MNGNEEESASSLKGFYAYKNTFDEASIWVDIPKQGLGERSQLFDAVSD